MAGDLLASSVQCNARSLAKNLLLGTSAECGLSVVESVTPEYSAPKYSAPGGFGGAAVLHSTMIRLVP